MESEVLPQPLETLMTRLGLSNADLVRASTEQLSFKMVQKGRKGRRLSPNIQEKILTALLTLKPGLQIRRRDLFRYPMEEAALLSIEDAMTLIGARKIDYPAFIDLLGKAGVNRYAVEVAAHTITFYGAAGEAYVKEGPRVVQEPLGHFDDAEIRSAIQEAQRGAIDYLAFLAKIHKAGIATYEVNIWDRRIIYRGVTEWVKEIIPPAGEAGESSAVPVSEAKTQKSAAKKAEKKPKKVAGKKAKVSKKNQAMTRKARMAHHKRLFQKENKKRR